MVKIAYKGGWEVSQIFETMFQNMLFMASLTQVLLTATYNPALCTTAVYMTVVYKTAVSLATVSALYDRECIKLQSLSLL